MQIIESAALAEESWLIKTSAREGMEERIQVKTKCVGTEQRDESNDVVFTRADGVDAAAGGADVAVLLHEVDEHLDGVGREVDVAVQRQQVRVVGDGRLALDRDVQVHQFVAQQVVHVHALIAPEVRFTGFGSTCFYWL